jgi:hypothetical protein
MYPTRDRWAYMDAELDGETKPTELQLLVDQPAALSGWLMAELEGSEIGGREADERKEREADEREDKGANETG